MVFRSEMCSTVLSALSSAGTEKSRLLTLSSSTDSLSAAGRASCFWFPFASSLMDGEAVAVGIRLLSSAVPALLDGFLRGVNQSVAPRMNARHAAITEIGSRGDVRPETGCFRAAGLAGAFRVDAGCVCRTGRVGVAVRGAIGTGSRRTCCMMRAARSAGGSAAASRTAVCRDRKSS